MNRLRKFLTISVLSATIFTMTGVFSNVNAAAMDGDLIKMDGLSSVYYLKGGKRFVFPNEATYFSWYSDWNGVKTIPQSELVSYPLGGNVTMRPGTKLVKITTNPAVYAVEPGGVLRQIASEADAIALYGSQWASMVVDVADSFFTNYTISTPLTAGTYPVGQIVNVDGTFDMYYWDGTNFRKIADEDAFYANNFDPTYVVTTSKTITAGGTPITGVEPTLINVAQGAGTGQSGNVPVGGSGLTVALASNTAVATNIPRQAVQVPFLSFNVTAAADGNVVLKNITATRGGIGAASDFSGVYLYDGDTRLTTARTVNSSTNKVTFTGLNYTVPAGTTKTLTLKADIANSGNNNNFSIAAASDIDASGAVVAGTFPVMGNTMVIVAQSVGTVTIAKTGSITNPKAGETAAKVAEFSVQMGTEDGTFNAITLYQVGNIANEKLTNFALKQGGTTVATATAMSGSNVHFTLTTPLSMDKGTSKIFEVYADVSSTARAADTVRFYLDNNADLYAVGKTYGFGMGVTRDNYDNSSNNGTDASWSSVDSGQITITQKGPAKADYATQQQDVELLRFDMASQINAEVRSTSVKLTAGGTHADSDNDDAGGLFNNTTANYTDIKLVDVATGSIVAGPQDVTYSITADDGTKTLTFSDTWTLDAGKTRTIKVTADVANFVPQANETIKAELVAFGGSSVKNLDTNLFVTDIVPSGNVIGATHNVKSGSLVTTKAAAPSVQTYINGKAGVDMLGLNLAAGTGKDVKVTSIKVTAVGANSCATEADCVSSAMLYDGTTLLSTKNISGDTITFSGLSLNIAKGTTKNLIVKTNLNKLSTVAGSTTLRFDITAGATDIIAQDMEGNTVGNTGNVTGSAHVIADAGSLSVTLAGDDAETESQILLAGAENQVLAKYRFSAVNENLKLTKVRIDLPDNSGEEVTSVSLWDGATRLTNDTSVTVDGADTYVDVNSFVADFIVPKDSYKTMTVKANLGTISGGATSGHMITAALAQTTNFEARGVDGSDTVLTDAGSVVTGRSMMLKKSKLTFTELALSNTAISNGAENEVYKFSVTADGDASLKQLVFDVTLTDNQGAANALTASSWKLFKGTTDITSLVNITEIDGSVANLATGTDKLIINWKEAGEELITGGTTVPYTLRATLSNFGTSADDDSIRVILNADSAPATTGYNKLVDLDSTDNQLAVGLGDGTATANHSDGSAHTTPTIGANIIWSDWASTSHSAATADTDDANTADTVTVSTSSNDWSNSYLLKSLPFSGKTMNN